MMGRTHAMAGAVAGVAVLPVLDRFGVDVNGWSLVVATVAAAGGAMLPDFDHPNATVAHTLGPVTKAVARVVGTVTGGHRNGTHSILGCLLLAAVTWAVTLAGPLATGLWLAFLFAVAMAALGVPVTTNRRWHAIICLAAAVVLVPLGVLTHVPVGALPWAVGLGAFAHVATDSPTKQGVPLLWPVSRVRFRIANVTTGGPFDTGLYWVLTLVLVVQVSMLAGWMDWTFPDVEWRNVIDQLPV